jgi:hypothetical protein
LRYQPGSGASGQTYNLPPTASGEVFTGAAYCQGAPLFGANSGNLYTIASGAGVAVAGSFGELTRDIAAITDQSIAGVLQAYTISALLSDRVPNLGQRAAEWARRVRSYRQRSLWSGVRFHVW